MSDRDHSANAPLAETGADDSIGLPRRAVLRATVGAGALVAGIGPAAASGQGGQAVVHEDDYRPDGSFEITEVSTCPEEASNPDGSCWDPPLHFQCDGEGGRAPPGKGGKIPFPYWHFNYRDDRDGAASRKLYTRDNKVRTGVTYHWPGSGKECTGQYPDGDENTDVLVQTGFSAGGGPD